MAWVKCGDSKIAAKCPAASVRLTWERESSVEMEGEAGDAVAVTV